MGIQSKDLLDQLADLQLAIEGFSLEQLSVEEARSIKSSFDRFRIHLEEQIWKPDHHKRARPQKPKTPVTSDIDGLIAAVSHDIRVPLQAITGFADLLLEAGISPQEKNYAASIRSASEILKGIIDELAIFSRLKEEEKYRIKIPFSPVVILEEAVVFTQILLKGQPVEIQLTTNENIPETLLGDPSRLNRILLNLLENAAKYATGGTIRLVVTASRTREGYTLVIEITDDGIGIPEEELPFIFKPYYQAKQGGETAGSGHGLGLTIVKKLIDEQGGTITVKSKEGEGSTFRLELPFENGPGSLTSPKRTEEKYAGKELQGTRILVFEDNPINAELLESRLQSWGCLVRIADRVPVGLQILEQHPVDLVLMDLRMPQMDGFQATNLIRKHKNPAISHIPVIALTADFMAVENQNIQEMGLDSVLLKPYDSQELYTIMSTLCRQGTSRENSPVIMKGEKGIRSKEGLVCLNYLESECVGGAGLLSKLVALFKGNLLEFAGRMKLCLLQEDHAGIAEAAHKILSSLKLIQATFYLELVEEIYREASEGGKIIRINSIYLKFLRHYPMLVKALECELEKRKQNGDES